MGYCYDCLYYDDCQDPFKGMDDIVECPEWEGDL